MSVTRFIRTPLFLFSVLAVAACSSSSTGTGNDGGTTNGSSGGIFGGAKKDGGTGTGTGTGTGNDAGTDTGQCSEIEGTDACTVCFRQSCCPEIQACASDQQCLGLFTCGNNCPETDEACFENCRAQYPVNDIGTAVGQCQADYCSAACGG